MLLSEKGLQSEALIRVGRAKMALPTQNNKRQNISLRKKRQKRTIHRPYTKEIQTIIEKNNIAINDYATNKNKETPCHNFVES